MLGEFSNSEAKFGGLLDRCQSNPNVFITIRRAKVMPICLRVGIKTKLSAAGDQDNKSQPQGVHDGGKGQACSLLGASTQAEVSGAASWLDSPSARASKSPATRSTNPNKTDRT